MPLEYHGPFVRDWDFMPAIVLVRCLHVSFNRYGESEFSDFGRMGDHWESHGSLDRESDWRLAV